jgi:hypothetical protein
MIRMKRIEVPKIELLEDATNAALKEMEDAGQEIISLDFYLPATATRKCSALIVYNDVVGINEDYDQRHSAYLSAMNRRALENSERESARRTERQAERDMQGESPTT